MIEQIKVTPNESPSDGVRFTHPSFGQLSASRVQGTSALYGSDFIHRNFIKLEITYSKMDRNLSSDWHHNGPTIVELSLSEAQWATFVSSLNVGGGVPCTLNFADGKKLPDLPDPTSRTEQFKGELIDTIRKSLTELSEALVLIEEMKIPVSQKKLLTSKIKMSIQSIESDLPWVASKFDGHAEKTVEKAKLEVNAYAMHTLMTAGVAQISGSKASDPAQAIELKDF